MKTRKLNKDKIRNKAIVKKYRLGGALNPAAPSPGAPGDRYPARITKKSTE